MADALTDTKLETWVIGALLDATGPVLRSSAAILIDTHGLTADCFGNARCRAVFEAVRDLSRERRPVDPQTVFTRVRGDVEKLQQLQVGNHVDGRLFEQHAQRLHEFRLKRRLRDEAKRLLSSITADAPVQQLIAQTSAIPADLSLPTSDEWGDEDATRIMRSWEAACDDPDAQDPIVATGITPVDQAIAGYVNNLNLIAGQESVGKSAFAASSIMANLEAGHTVGVFGLEDATEWITRRHLAARLNLPAFTIGRRVSPDVLLRGHKELASIASLTRRMLVHREGGITPADLVAKAKRWILRHQCRVIFIDHGGEIAHRSADSRDRHDLAVKATYQQLRDLAIQYNVAIVVLCHFSADADKIDGPPHTGQLAESRYIGRMARLALGLWRGTDGDLRCTVMKCTDGPRGQTVALEFEKGGAVVSRQYGKLIDLQAERESRRKQREKKKWIDDEPKKPEQQSLLPDPND